MQLVSKVLESGDLKSFLDSGMSLEDIQDTDCRSYLEFIVEYYMNPQHPRTVPTKEVFLEARPDAVIPEPDRTTVKELVQICKVRSAKLLCQKLGEELILQAEEDPTKAFEHAVEFSVGQIGKLTDTRTISLSDYTEELLAEYERSKQGIFSGVPWPWEPLNKVTKGIENGTFTLIYGRAKQMKTWLALYMGAEHYRRFNDARVLVYSLEMPVKQMAQRVAAIIARVPYAGSLLGTLEPAEEERFRAILTELKVEEEASSTNGRRKGLYIVGPSGDKAGTLDVRNKIEMFEPDLVIIDGVYYLAGKIESKRLDWQEIAKVSRDLKISANEYNIPIVGVNQANRDNDEDDTMRDMGFSDNLSRDPDVIMKVHKQQTTNLGNVLAVAFKGVREFDYAGMLIHGNPAVNFDFIKEFHTTEQIKEFLTKNKQAVAGLSAAEDPNRALGHENFIQAQNMFKFGGK
jgi:replicative DNA helicase